MISTRYEEHAFPIPQCLGSRARARTGTGVWRLTVKGPGIASFSRWITVAGQALDLDLRVQERPRITGIVRDAKGNHLLQQLTPWPLRLLIPGTGRATKPQTWKGETALRLQLESS